MNTTLLSKKYQIVVPKEVREAMGLREGDEVSLRPIDADTALLVRRSADPVGALRGLGKDVWKKLGGSHRYIRNERASWSKK